MALFERTNRKYLLGQVMWFGSWLFITAVGLALNPDASGHGTHQRLGLPPCPSVLMFDRPCPGCGLTTSWSALLHGNLPLSLAAHALGPLMYALFTLSALFCAYGLVRSMRFDSDTRWVNLTAKTFAAVFIIFGVVRFAITPQFATEREKLIVKFATGQ
jgi:hypothetical protein